MIAELMEKITAFLSQHLIAIVLVVGLLGNCFLYFMFTRAKVATLEHDNEVLIAAVEQQRQTIESLKRDSQLQTRLSADAIDKEQALRRSAEEQRERLFTQTKGKLVLEAAADKHSKLLEKNANAATAAALQCLQVLLSGASCGGKQ